MDKILTGQKIRLRPKHLLDAVEDYAWRTDPELSRLDAAQPLSLSFDKYLKGYAAELYLFGRDALNLAIETTDGKHIGNCACFALDKTKKEAEFGIIIGDQTYWDKGYGADATITLLDYLFSETELERLYLKTLEWNLRAQKCFQKCGFVPCGRLVKNGHKFVLMEIRRHQFEAKSQHIALPLHSSQPHSPTQTTYPCS